jgi:hypothetical protein
VLPHWHSEQWSTTPGRGLRIKRHWQERALASFSVECPWQESSPWGSVLRVICVTIALSYNRGCTIAQWLRRSLLASAAGRVEYSRVSVILSV